MITVALQAKARRHIGGWVAPDTRWMTVEIEDHKFPEIVAIIGPAGSQGTPGAVALPVKINVLSPAGTWILAHSLARIPMVQLFTETGEQMMSDVDVTSTQITVTHAAPRTGFVLAY